jgi:hypothetical protein
VILAAVAAIVFLAIERLTPKAEDSGDRARYDQASRQTSA